MDVKNPGTVSPADQSFGRGVPAQQPAPGGPLPGGNSVGVKIEGGTWDAASNYSLGRLNP
jgi:hypothetical protein